MKVEYSGVIYTKLASYLAEADGFSFGQKLTQIEKTAKKRFYDMSDEEIYESLITLMNNKEYYKDEKLSQEDFKNWIENAVTK